MKITVINGPNLNMLGCREPEIYGEKSYEELEKFIEDYAEKKGVEAIVLQSNGEGEIIDFIQYAQNTCDGIIINPCAYTHYSYAIYDALKMAEIPCVEVHLSDITKREEFRKVSVTAPACDLQIYGKGFSGYADAVDYIIKKVKDNEKQ